VYGEHAVALAVVLNVPVPQSLHCRSAVVEPGAEGDTYRPAEQLLHGAHALAELMSLSQEPVGQAPPGFVPPGQYQPTGQAMHVALMVLVAGAVWRVPAAHCPAGTHCAAFCVLEYVPDWQAVQARSADAVPPADT
jgi:hypothetical protein